MQEILSLRFPLFAKWYITSKCNLRCKHCYLTDYTVQPEGRLIQDVIDYFRDKGLLHISLLGGEPLVRDDLEDIVARIVQGGMGVSITTNGILVTRARADALVAAGARRFNVSIEGDNAVLNDAVRGVGTFPAILRGVAHLRDAGAQVTLSTTLNGKNLHRLPDVAALAAQLKVKALKLNTFIPVGTGSSMDSSHILSSGDLLEVRRQVEVLSRQYPDLTFDGGYFTSQHNVRWMDRRQRGSTFGCGAGTNTIIINSNFTVSACDMLVESDRSALFIREPQDIERIWQNDPIFRKWRGLTTKSNLREVSSFKEVHQHGCHLLHDTSARLERQ